MIRMDRADGENSWHIRVEDAAETDQLARALAPLCGPGTMLALDGDLGAGKTRFSQAFANGLGVQETVNSPTFTIIKEYEDGRLPLYHMDVYRLTEAEAGELGLDDYFYGEGITLVEWAERIPDELPDERLHIYIRRCEQESARDIVVEATGAAYVELGEKWMQSLATDVSVQQSGQAPIPAGPACILALDTSTGMLSTAILIQGRVVAERHSEAERNHSIRLVPAIDELLKEAGLEPSKLDGIAVGAGPGSYTGVRIAVTVAKTLAWSLQIPLVQVSTLAALALGGKQAFAKNGSGPVWVVPILDARRDNVYTGLYAMWEGEANLQNMSGDSNRPLQLWLDEVMQAATSGKLEGVAVQPPSEIVVVGETSRFVQQLLAAELSAQRAGISLHWHESRMHAAHLGALALAREWRTDDVHDVVPNYTQLAEAEVKLQAKRK